MTNLRQSTEKRPKGALEPVEGGADACEGVVAMNDDHGGGPIQSAHAATPVLSDSYTPSAYKGRSVRPPATPRSCTKKLRAHYVEKPWGRTDLPPAFARPAGKKVGEVWLAGDSELPLLAKYLFTSEKLSVQVHPNDEQAKARGFPRGKSECWFVLDAEPGAAIGLGLRREVAEAELRSAALDGSIEELIDWRPVRAGDFLYVAAGTIHAIGGGISLLEFQQNSDATFRLYDYGRPRALHLEDAAAVADRRPFDGLAQRVHRGEDRILVSGPHFRLIHCHADHLRDRRRWVLPLEGRIRSGGNSATAGEGMLLEPGDELETENARMLIGAVV